MPAGIRHIVMWTLRGDTPAEKEAARLKVRTAFEGLVGRIEGLRHVEIGFDVSGVDYACDVVLVSEFTSASALRSYATHPEHLRIREELGDLRTARFQVDYEIADAASLESSHGARDA